MESKTVERVTEWDSEPFTGGHVGLRELAEREFTGAVTDGGAWLFMLNGRVLGVFDGDVAQFDDADGTAYVAPDQSLPLLFAMQERGGEVRGEYYTEETPISEVDQTLQSGNFTGYVELSENVLSGNYYLVYYGGRLLPVAFVGNQERRLTGDEAFERAADEVGIYRVKTVDLDITDVPAPESTAATETDGDESASTAAAAGIDVDESESATASDDDDSGTESASSAGATPGTAESSTTDEPATAAESTQVAESSAADEPADQDVEQPSASRVADATGTTSATDDAATTASAQAEDTASASESDEAASDADGDPFEAESAWRGTRTIPALDPAESVSMQTSAETSGGTSTQAAESVPESEGPSSEEFEALREERDQLRARVEELETETERLSDERDRLETERDEAAETTEELEAELDELRATVDELESELEAAESELSAAQEYVPEGDHELSPEEAMAGTSLFIRYERKGGPTLEDAHSGDADREAVNDNLRLEHHTEFDDDGAIVDGEPFDEWLTSTIEYGFVQWLTRTFAHDVRETRNQTAMGKLFDTIPNVDRVEFRGTVSLEEAEEAVEADTEMESASFDVVLRDRMGQPLIVTDLNDSREPATEPMLESLIRNATPVGEANEQLAAAFFVTSSYYEPGALETAEEATGGGFLSRGKNKSFVKLSRKDGYHVCLVETRDGEFHVSVPEL